jgi:hypothetical protein
VVVLGGGITLVMTGPQFTPVGSVTGSPTNSSVTRTGATTTPVSAATSIATTTQVQSSPSPTQNVNLPNILHATFTLDNVTVTIASPFLPGTFLTTNRPETTTYVATAEQSQQVHPWGSISITACPYGTKPTTEGVPIAQAGGAQGYRDFLYNYRIHNGYTTQTGPISNLFGQQVQSLASLNQGSATVAYSSTLVVEWVVEAGNRIWIIRLTNEQPLGTVDFTPATSFLASLPSSRREYLCNNLVGDDISSILDVQQAYCCTDRADVKIRPYYFIRY